jgi:hypothetical protein
MTPPHRILLERLIISCKSVQSAAMGSHAAGQLVLCAFREHPSIPRHISSIISLQKGVGPILLKKRLHENCLQNIPCNFAADFIQHAIET